MTADNADSPVHLSPRRPPLEVSLAPSSHMVQISFNSSKMYQQARMALGSSDGTGLSRCNCCYTSLLWVTYHNHSNVRISCFFSGYIQSPIPPYNIVDILLHVFFFFNIVAIISTVDRDESVQQYLADLDNMHKERRKSVQQTRIYLNIQVVLEVPGEKELRAVAEKLSEAGIQVFSTTFRSNGNMVD